MLGLLTVIVLSYLVALTIVAPAQLVARLMHSSLGWSKALTLAGWCACGIVVIAWIGRITA